MADYAGYPTTHELRIFRQLIDLLSAFIEDRPFDEDWPFGEDYEDEEEYEDEDDE